MLPFRVCWAIILGEHLFQFRDLQGGGAVTGEELNALFILRKDLRTAEELLASLRAAADVPGVPDASKLRGANRPRDTVGNLLSEIDDLSARADSLRGEIRSREASAAAFIRGIEDNQTRLIFQLRFMRGCTWRRIARIIGGGNTADSVRKMYARYLSACVR